MWLPVRQSALIDLILGVRSDTYDGGLKREAKGQWKNVPVIFLAPRFAINAIMGVKENHQAGLSDGCINWFESLVIKPLAYPSCSDDYSFQMRKGGDLLDCLNESRRADSRHKREETKAVKTLETVILDCRTR